MRILVLEIEPLSLLIKHMLSRFNYDADVTPDIAEALQWYNERAPYDIVLTGLFSANGISLAAHIRRTNPTQVVGIMTGIGGEEPLSRVHELNFPVLRKPYSADELIDFIENIKPTGVR